MPQFSVIMDLLIPNIMISTGKLLDWYQKEILSLSMNKCRMVLISSFTIQTGMIIYSRNGNHLIITIYRFLAAQKSLMLTYLDVFLKDQLSIILRMPIWIELT